MSDIQEWKWLIGETCPDCCSEEIMTLTTCREPGEAHVGDAITCQCCRKKGFYMCEDVDIEELCEVTWEEGP